jgi:hypothetical protein
MMTTYYRIEKKIKVTDFLNGLAEAGVAEAGIVPGGDFSAIQAAEVATDQKERVLTDGNNYLAFYVGDDGTVQDLKRYAWCGAPGRILDAIAEVFDTEIWSEYNYRYWGFESREEEEAWHQKLHEEHQQEFYDDLVRHIAGDPGPAQRYSHTVNDKMSALTGEPVGSISFTIGFTKLQIGKALVEKDPTFANPDRKHDLLKAIDETYKRDHCVTVTLTEQEMAEAKMRVTHERDLLRA